MPQRLTIVVYSAHSISVEAGCDKLCSNRVCWDKYRSGQHQHVQGTSFLVQAFLQVSQHIVNFLFCLLLFPCCFLFKGLHLLPDNLSFIHLWWRLRTTPADNPQSFLCLPASNTAARVSTEYSACSPDRLLLLRCNMYRVLP